MCSEQEIARLREKCNALIKLIEGYKAREAQTGLGLFSCLIDCLCYFEENGQAVRLQKKTPKQQYICVPSTEFFDAFSQRMPLYRKKDVIGILRLFEITDTSATGHTTVRGKKRVLKIHEDKFLLLTKGAVSGMGGTDEPVVTGQAGRPQNNSTHSPRQQNYPAFPAN